MHVEITWFPTNVYQDIFVTRGGQVKNSLTNKILKQTEMRTTVGTYLYVYFQATVNGRRKRITTGVHRLVCMAFHGTPEGYEKLDVNHKDTDKHNNNDWNLEWCTHSQNVKHAFQTGANKYALASRMTDLETGDIYEFISMKEVAEFFQLKHKKGFHIAANHTVKPYKSRYLFEITGDYHAQSRSSNSEVYCVDLRNSAFYRFENLTQLQLKTGLNAGSVKTVLASQEIRLFNGCVIAKVEDKERLFEYVSKITQCDIDQSVSDYLNNPSRNRMTNDHGWVVKNYITGDIREYRSTREVANLINISKLGSGNGKYDLKLYHGYSVKRLGDQRDFIDYSDDYVQLSLKKDVNGSKPIRVTDLISNTTEDWPSIGSFAKSVGLPGANRITQSLVEIKLNGQYSFEYLKIFNT